MADKAYTSRRNRRYLRRQGISHTIPERLDQQRHRKNRASRGGRPTGFDSERYKERNTVERAINRLKGFRAVATCYDKLAPQSSPRRDSAAPCLGWDGEEWPAPVWIGVGSVCNTRRRAGDRPVSPQEG
ncbi:transposase [Streptomyces pratensis]|nr:transposase [Streptomyces pratensis]MBD2835327.1 transposase [Streptomyces pratensis]